MIQMFGLRRLNPGTIASVRRWLNAVTFFLTVLSILPSLAFASESKNALTKPNIVLVLMDNLGWGELGSYGGGILRGAATPRIDALAEEGLRLLNFNVEAQCTPSRAALMTGRYAIRSGNGSVPFFTQVYGLTQWEETLAEVLARVGYRTGAFGKWHLGHGPGRYPTDQGFDEWYGIPHSSDESAWPTGDRFREGSHPAATPSSVLRAQRGETAKVVKTYDLNARATIDREITNEAIRFIRSAADDGEPFFAYVPYTAVHYPLLTEQEFAGATGNGQFADVLTQMDHYVGELLDTVEELGLSQNTIFIFTSDNGPEMFLPAHGFSGPWRGTYFTGLEGSLRVPFILRWPGRVAERSVSNEIVHQMDIFTTLVALAGGALPDDRIIDGHDQSAFFQGKTAESAREGFVVYVGETIFGVKWRNWKMMMKEVARGAGEPLVEYTVPLFYDLHVDPKEEHPMDPRVLEDLWVRYPMSDILKTHLQSLRTERPITAGTPDPYSPES